VPSTLWSAQFIIPENADLVDFVGRVPLGFGALNQSVGGSSPPRLTTVAAYNIRPS